jgi:hypothetical protein
MAVRNLVAVSAVRHAGHILAQIYKLDSDAIFTIQGYQVS